MARRHKFIPPIERVRDGFVFNIGDDERQLVTRLMTELGQLLMGEADDPRLIRIFPPAYHLADDADAERRVPAADARGPGRIATGGDRDRQPLPAERPAQSSEEAMIAFVQAINGLRLVLGTMLDVVEDDDPDDIDDDDPLVGEHHLYNFLSWLLDWAVRALGEPVTQRET